MHYFGVYAQGLRLSRAKGAAFIATIFSLYIHKK